MLCIVARRHVPVLLLALGGLAGCGRGDEQGPSTKGDDRAAVVDPDKSGGKAPPAGGNDPPASRAPGSASLSGRVTLDGDVPPLRVVSVTKDVEHCKAAGGEVQDVVVSADGGLAGVVVEIQGVDEPAGGWTWKEGSHVVTQKGCRFEPSLLVVPAGSEIEIRNDDEVTHNVNTGEWNVLQSADDAPIVRSLKSTLPVPVRCNIHSWMEATVYPARSPLFAVTDADGRYEIAGVPSGEYRVVYFHPTLGQVRERITFEGGKTATKDVAIESTN